MIEFPTSKSCSFVRLKTELALAKMDENQLNNLDLEIQQGDVDSIIKNPKEYALNFVEFQVTNNLMKYIEAHKLGKDFALKNMGIKDGKRG